MLPCPPPRRGWNYEPGKQASEINLSKVLSNAFCIKRCLIDAGSGTFWRWVSIFWISSYSGTNENLLNISGEPGTLPSTSCLDPSLFLIPQLSRKPGAIFKLKVGDNQSFMGHVHLYVVKESKTGRKKRGEKTKNADKYLNLFRGEMSSLRIHLSVIVTTLPFRLCYIPK